MALMDIPPNLQERVVCSITAAIKYEVPANIVLGISEKEGGKPGQWVKNTNSSFDVGAMQFNTNYLRDLRKYGITANDVAQAGCYAYDLAAWRLRGHLKNDSGDIWTRAANYHSRTPKYNAPYRADLIRKASKWASWLDANFVTYTVTGPGVHPIETQTVQVKVGQEPQKSEVDFSSDTKKSNLEPRPHARLNNSAAALALANEFTPSLAN